MNVLNMPYIWLTSLQVIWDIHVPNMFRTYMIIWISVSMRTSVPMHLTKYTVVGNGHIKASEINICITAYHSVDIWHWQTIGELIDIGPRNLYCWVSKVSKFGKQVLAWWGNNKASIYLSTLLLPHGYGSSDQPPCSLAENLCFTVL